MNQLFGKSQTDHRLEACAEAPNETEKDVLGIAMIDSGWRLIQRLPFGTMLPDIQIPVPHILIAENYHTQSEHSLS